VEFVVEFGLWSRGTESEETGHAGGVDGGTCGNGIVEAEKMIENINH
jgi:hypothetical protein